MKLRHQFLSSLPALLLLLTVLTACGGGAEPLEDRKPEPPEDAGAEPADMGSTVRGGGQYAEPVDTLEDLLKCTSNVVEATLLSKESEPNCYVFRFQTDRDFTGNTPDEFNMYDQDDGRYIAGHSYFLFLDGADLALRPHTLYTTVRKDLIFDLDGSDWPVSFGWGGSGTPFTLPELEDAVERAAAAGTIGTSLEALPPVSDSDDLGELASEADVIAEVRLSYEMNYGEYSSGYSVEVQALLKAPEGFEASELCTVDLPPALDARRTYYLLLKEDPGFPGTYVPFSRVYPVLEASAENLAALSLT